jgi:uncharacterized protein (TIGR02118 family)
MTEVYITYPGNASIRFDRGYYSKEHLPLVKRHWEKYGLLRVAVFYPDDANSGILAICVCTFRDDAAVSASFASPETAETDIKNFTDVSPMQRRAVPLSK